jgi:predicted DNA-binding transcriptional regulator YafY
MPVNKKPELRYQRINDYFNARRGQSSVVRLEDLAETLGISLRQLNTDIKVMREELGAPMTYDTARRGWRYTEEFDLVGGLPLRKQDVLHLRIAVEMLAKGGQLKDFKELPEVLRKIYRASRRWVSDQTPEKAVYFDPLPHYDGARHLSFFLDAVENRRRAEFLYRGFHAETPKNVLFDPYFLRHYDQRWYVGGFSHDPTEGFVRVFPLERIVETPRAAGFFHDKPPQYNAETYWNNIYGITIPPRGRVEEVVLEFNAVQGKYFLSTPFFQPFEIMHHGPEYLTVRLRLMPNIDLVRKLAAYGPDVRVMAPVALAKQIADLHRRAWEAYQPPPAGLVD